MATEATLTAFNVLLDNVDFKGLNIMVYMCRRVSVVSVSVSE